MTDFVSELTKLGRPEDLLLIITADHGEEFLEHGALRHVQLYDEVMQIPLFLRWPGEVPEDLRIETPVSLVDVVPTILEMAGAPPIEGDGLSLASLFEGDARERTVFGQAARNRWVGGKIRYVARNNGAKCIVQDGDDWVQCFDLTTDPGEQNPISPANHPELAQLHGEAIAYRAIDLAKTSEEAAESPAQPEGTVEPIDPVRQEKLKALGYIE